MFLERAAKSLSMNLEEFSITIKQTPFYRLLLFLSSCIFFIINKRMPKTVDNYIIQKELFKDSFQIQYLLSEHKILKKPFTLKKVDKVSEQCVSKQQEKVKIKLSFALSCIQNEIQMLRELKSQKLIKCLKILKAKNSIYAVYDQHPQKNLQKILSTEYLTFQRKQTIIHQILSLIKQIHQNNIAIGNLQPKYLYLNLDNKIFTSTFLISKRLGLNPSEKIDNLFLDSQCQYYAPELLKTGTLSKAADVYSLGMIIKSMSFDKQQNDLLTPRKISTEGLKDIFQKMIDPNPQKRPSILQLQKALALNRSRNKSTCGSNTSRDNDQKINDLKRLQSYKSEATLKFYNQRNQINNLLEPKAKKSTLNKRFTLNLEIGNSKVQRVPFQPRKIFDTEITIQSSRYMTLQIPNNPRKSREDESAKSGSSSNNNQISVSKNSSRDKFNDILLTRNLVSFLIQMSLFAYAQNSFSDLCICLTQEALKYTKNVMKSVDYLIREENNSKQTLKQFYQECKQEKNKLIEIDESLNLLRQGRSKKCGEENVYNDILLIEQLKKFGKTILNLYSGNFIVQSQKSQLSDTVRGSKQQIQQQRLKEQEQKLFKTLLLLKRIEYGSYYQFFKAKIHHPNKKFWHQHYFEFERTFGGKYFIIQIKDLITKKA